MFLTSSRLLFSLLVFAAFICNANITFAQELTEADLAKGQEIQSLILEAKEAFQTNQLNVGADRIKLAEEKLIAISASGNSALVRRLKPSYLVIRKAREVLTANGVTFDKPLPLFSTLLKGATAAEAESNKSSDEKIKELITMGGELFKQKRFNESADHIRDAQTEMVKLIATSNADQADQYKNDYRRIGKAQKLLTSKGFTFEPQPDFDSLPGSSVATTEGSGSKQIASNTQTPGSGTKLAEPTPEVEQKAIDTTPLTGIDKIRADRKQVFEDMFALYGTVKDDASANAAIPKFQELTKRLEAIGDETGVILATGGNTAEFYQMIQAEQLEMMQMAKKNKPVDLSKYPVLKQELQKMQSALQSSALKRPR